MSKRTDGKLIYTKRLETKNKRKNQDCKVFELKVVEKRLNLEQLNALKMMFVEAKWIYNHILNLSQSGTDIFKINYKDHPTIKHFNKDRVEVEESLEYLSSQMKQDLFQTPKENICKLSKSKKTGNKVGKLKFKSEVNRIPLRQFGVTYKFTPEHNKVKIQGIKKAILVRGLNQIEPEFEVTNAVLIKKPSGFYIKVTTFQELKEKTRTGNMIGLDFGIKTGITNSNNEKFNWNFQEPKKLKRTQTDLENKKKGSSNYYKTKEKLNLQYEKLSNQKKDAINKFVSKLIDENDFVVIQDESIAKWKSSGKSGWGSRIHHGILGGIIAGLKNNPTTLKINKWIKTTQMCSRCGRIKKMSLGDREYDCPNCGLSVDRDLNSALNILKDGLKLVRTDYPEFKLVEQIGLKATALKQEDAIF